MNNKRIAGQATAQAINIQITSAARRHLYSCMASRTFIPDNHVPLRTFSIHFHRENITGRKKSPLPRKNPRSGHHPEHFSIRFLNWQLSVRTHGLVVFVHRLLLYCADDVQVSAVVGKTSSESIATRSLLVIPPCHWVTSDLTAVLTSSTRHRHVWRHHPLTSLRGLNRPLLTTDCDRSQVSFSELLLLWYGIGGECKMLVMVWWAQSTKLTHVGLG